MSISYQPKDSSVQGLQLKVQELVVTTNDAIVTVSGGNTVVDVKETISEVRAVLHCVSGADAACKTGTLVGSNKQIQVTGLALGSGECLIIKYVV